MPYSINVQMLCKFKESKGDSPSLFNLHTINTRAAMVVTQFRHLATSHLMTKQHRMQIQWLTSNKYLRPGIGDILAYISNKTKHFSYNSEHVSCSEVPVYQKKNLAKETTGKFESKLNLRINFSLVN